MDTFSPNFSPDFSPIKMDPKNPLHHTSFNHSEHPINLLNFDPSWRRPDFLDSPRSIEACLLLGIEQRELLQKDIADLKDEYIPPQFLKHSEEYLNLKLHYSEHIRLQKLGKCIEAREKLIEEGQRKEMSYYNPFSDSPKKTKKRSQSPEQASVIAWNLDDELKKVEEFRKKQEGRIESFINSENERMEKRENMYNKLLRIKELEDERTADWHRRREEAKNRSLSRDKLRTEFSPAGKKARHQMLEKEFSKIMTQFEEGEGENKKGKKKRRNRAERMKQKAANDTSRTEESVIYTQNKLEFVSQVLAKRREIADKAYDDEIKRKVMAQSAERFRRNKSENRFHTEKSREESPSFFDRWDQDEMNRSQSRLERDMEKILRPAQKEEHERQVRQRREDQEDLRELVGKLMLDQRDHEISRAEEQKEKIKEINLKKFMYEYLKNEEALQSIPRDERARIYKGIKLNEKMKNKRDNQERIRIERQAVYEHKKALEAEYNKERSSIRLSFMKEKEKLDYELRERLQSSSKRKSKLKRCKSSAGYKNPKNFLTSSGYESRATAYDSRTLRTDTQDRTYRGGFNMMSIDSHSEMEGERSFERDVYEDIIGENDEMVRQKSSKRGHVASRLNIIYEKGQSHIKVPKILKSSSREMRPILKSQPSERSIRSNQAEAEWVHAKVAKAKKDQVRSLLGLLELEIENNEDSNNKDIEGSAQKILRFIKGQEQEIWKMMKNVNYLDLNPLEKFTE